MKNHVRRYYNSTQIQSRPSSKERNWGAFDASRVRKLVAVCFLAACSVWFIFFFFASDNFETRSIVLRGIENIPEAELRNVIDDSLEKRRFLLFKNSNLFLFSRGQLIDDINKHYIAESISVNRDFPFTLTVDIKEKVARLLLRSVYLTPVSVEPSVAGAATMATSVQPTLTSEADLPAVDPNPAITREESYYFLDVNGIVVSSVQPSEDELRELPLIEIERTNENGVEVGEEILDRETITYLSSIFEAFVSSPEQIHVAYVRYNPAMTKEVVFVTTEGWSVMLTQDLPLAAQAAKLELALRERIKDMRARLQYVDLRVKDRVYFR